MVRNRFSQGFSAVIALIIAAVVIVGIVGAVMMRRGSTSAPSTASDRSTTETASPTGDMSSTITDLVARGQSLECDFKMPTVTGQPNPFGTGKLYTTGKKGRSMISGNASGMNMEANAIYEDETAYSWITVAGTTMGFKFDKDKMDSMSSEMTPEQKQQAEQVRASMLFQCKPWTPDESKFVLPTGVEFK